MSDQYYRFFPGDYLRDTGDLTLVEHGAYMILLHHYYTQEWLPADKQKLYRICRAFTEEERKSIDSVVSRYFTENGNGHIVNKKAEKEIAGRKAYFEEQARKAKLGADARWKDHIKENAHGDAHGHNPGMPEAMPERCPPSPSPSPIPLPIPKKVKTLFVDTSDEVRLSERLFEKMLQNNPQAKKPNMQVWAKHVELMINQDGRIWQDIQAVIDWCQEDDFWKLNILSTKKLREKFDQLWVKMTKGGKKNGPKPDNFSGKEYVGTPIDEIPWVKDKDL